MIERANERESGEINGKRGHKLFIFKSLGVTINNGPLFFTLPKFVDAKFPMATNWDLTTVR